MKNLQYARVGTVRAKADNSSSEYNNQSMTGIVVSFKSSANKLFNNTVNNISCK